MHESRFTTLWNTGSRTVLVSQLFGIGVVVVPWFVLSGASFRLSATNHKWFVASLSSDTVTPIWSNVLRSSGHLSSPPSHRPSSPAPSSRSSPLPCRPSVMPPENHLVLQSAMTERWRPLLPESPAAWQSSLTFNGIHPADSSDRTDPSCNSYFLQEVLKIRDFHMLRGVG